MHCSDVAQSALAVTLLGEHRRVRAGRDPIEFRCSERHMYDGDPLIAARAALPMVMNDSLAAIFGGGRRDRRHSAANPTASLAGTIIADRLQPWAAIAWVPAPYDSGRNADKIGLGQGNLPC